MNSGDRRLCRLNQLRDELARLLKEEIESLESQTFLGISEEQLREQDQRLHRIRELSADLLGCLKEGAR